MRLEYPYCVFENHFSDEFCDRVTEMGESAAPMKAEVARDPENNLRDSTVSWLTDTPSNAWLYDQLTTFIKQTNDIYWQWNISQIESIQYTSYGPGQFYTWHADQRRKPYAPDSRWPGMIRKISMSIHLTEGTEYEGGDFLIEEVHAAPDLPEKRLKRLSNARSRGTAIIFPSHLYHRVEAVTSGRRRSLVIWFLGPPFV